MGINIEVDLHLEPFLEKKHRGKKYGPGFKRTLRTPNQSRLRTKSRFFSLTLRTFPNFIMFFYLNTLNLPDFSKKGSKCKSVRLYIYTYNDHRRNCGEIILGLAILNMSLRFLQVLLFLMAPAAFRSHAETSSCICMHACMCGCMYGSMHGYMD